MADKLKKEEKEKSFLPDSGTCYIPFDASVTEDYSVIEKGGVRYMTTPQVARWETTIATNIVRLMCEAHLPHIPDNVIRMRIASYEKMKGRKLDPKQAEAVVTLTNSPVGILTGGPGTGKTTVMDALRYVLMAVLDAPTIKWCAPTGKAAARLSESVGDEALTIHREIGISYDPETYVPVNADILVCDEFSMCDEELAASLFRSVSTGHRIVMLGDTNQLPSVGRGAVLRDLIRSNVVAVCRLTKTFRQAAGSVLLDNIKSMQNDKKPVLKEGSDFQVRYIPENGLSEEELALKCDSVILSEYYRMYKKYGIDQVAVLLPYRKAGYCSNYINTQVQMLMNNPKFRKHVTRESDGRMFALNDRVMQLENRSECVNGQVGKVIAVVPEGITVSFGEGNNVWYGMGELEQLELAYAMTVIKSQGSEYKGIVNVTLNSHVCGLSRNNIYTGVSRAKAECVEVCQKKALQRSFDTDANAGRLTFLTERLQRERTLYRQKYGV